VRLVHDLGEGALGLRAQNSVTSCRIPRLRRLGMYHFQVFIYQPYLGSDNKSSKINWMRHCWRHDVGCSSMEILNESFDLALRQSFFNLFGKRTKYLDHFHNFFNAFSPPSSTTTITHTSGIYIAQKLLTILNQGPPINLFWRVGIREHVTF